MQLAGVNVGARSRLCIAGALLAAVAASAAGGTCLIISEVVDGAESGGCPNWIELTNTGLSDFTFTAGGIIVQLNNDDGLEIAVDLTGITIVAGQSFVIASEDEGCSGAFRAIYGMDADLYTFKRFGDGDDRYIITDTADASHVIDIYGEFGVDGSGQVWEYTQGYAYRLPAYNCGSGLDFTPDEWFFGGVGSLDGEDNTQLLLEFTTPKIHEYDPDCVPGDLNADGCVDQADLGILLADWNCTGGGCPGDADGDGDTDQADLGVLLAHWGQGC